MKIALSTAHHVTFAGTRFGHNEFAGRCTCGWSIRGTKADCYNRAAVHDLEQWDIDDPALTEVYR